MVAPYDSRAIANEFLARNGGPMNQMKLQKLSYIAHGWHSAIQNSPLIGDRIEAWDGGPVFRRLWNHIRDFGISATTKLMDDPKTKKPYRADLTPLELSVIEHVWKKYGRYTGVELSEMTHEPGTPWSNAYFGNGRNAPLSQSDIENHFRELALAGRRQTA